ncbi:MAG: hypothetical protein MUO26_01530 [Methanotrichaceae archaeon]|nr:hypothetical protein [Methanotrichaceae archaeon]
MLKADDFFLSGKTGGVMAAIVPWEKGYVGVAPAHVFHFSGTPLIRIGSQLTKVAYFSNDADLAIFPLFCHCQLTEMDKPKLENAILLNARTTMGCRITDISWSIAYMALQPGNLPGPGDSGTPAMQSGKVVGMLLSLNMHNYKGILMSAELIWRELTEI